MFVSRDARYAVFQWRLHAAVGSKRPRRRYQRATEYTPYHCVIGLLHRAR